MKTKILAFIVMGMSLGLKAQNIVLIKNVNVWDGTANNLKMDYNVLVVDNLIKNINKKIAVPDSIQIIDGNGGTLIPGLSDAHVHLSINGSNFYDKDNMDYVAIRTAKSAENFLICGFTKVRDLGWLVMGTKKAIDEGLIPGPRIYSSGAMISQTSGHGDLYPDWVGKVSLPFTSYVVVDGVADVLKATRNNLKIGASQIKLFAGGGVSSPFDPIHTVQFTFDEIRAAVQAAEDWGTYVAVHAYSPESIIRSLEAGVKCIDHGQLINEEAMLLIKKKNAWLIPQSKWSLEPEPDWGNIPKSRMSYYKKANAVNQGAYNEMELAKKHGVKLDFGTDEFGELGKEYKALDEFTSRVRWFTPLEVLKQTTTANAELFSLSGEIIPYPVGKLGVIEKGAYADMLIYYGNPLKDISVIVNYKDNLKFIMKDGKIYKNEL